MKKLLLLLISIPHFTQPLSAPEAACYTLMASGSAGVLYSVYGAGSLLLKIRTLKKQLAHTTLPAQRTQLALALDEAYETLEEHGYRFLGSCISGIAGYTLLPREPEINLPAEPQENPQPNPIAQPPNQQTNNQQPTAPAMPIDLNNQAQAVMQQIHQWQQDKTHRETNQELTAAIQKARDIHALHLKRTLNEPIDPFIQTIQALNPRQNIFLIACPLCKKAPVKVTDDNAAHLKNENLYQKLRDFWSLWTCPRHPLCVECWAENIHNKNSLCAFEGCGKGFIQKTLSNDNESNDSSNNAIIAPQQLPQPHDGMEAPEQNNHNLDMAALKQAIKNIEPNTHQITRIKCPNTNCNQCPSRNLKLTQDQRLSNFWVKLACGHALCKPCNATNVACPTCQKPDNNNN